MYKHFFKPLLDFIFALILLPFLLLVVIPIAIAIAIDDGFPIFYKHKRVGKNKKLYSMLKFRTMKKNCLDIRLADGSTYNGKDDPRVTKVGRFLRKTSLDELPQIFNVLTFKMSFIGPRPSLDSDLPTFLPDEMAKMDVRPGLSGYNQAYFRNSISAREKRLNDAYYAKRVSFWFDLKILFKTIKTVLFGDNVYNNNDNKNADASEEKSEVAISSVAEMEEKKRVLVVGASLLQTPIIKKAKELGYFVMAVDADPKAYGFSYVDEYCIIDIKDKEKCLEYAKFRKIDGILTGATDYPIETISYVAEKMGLNAIPLDIAKRVKNKNEIRKVVKNPDGFIHFEISSINDIEKLKDVKYPLIVKPCDGSGSRGITKVLAFEKLKDAVKFAIDKSTSKRAVVETFLCGKEYGVESVIVDGEPYPLVIMDKEMTEGEIFAELGHATPSSLPLDIQEKIREYVKKAIKDIGLTTGACNMDLIVTDDGEILLCDVGARMGGNLIGSHIVPLSTGIDYIGLLVRQAVGEKVSLDSVENKRAIATRIFDFEKGIVKSMPDLKAFYEDEKVLDIILKVGVGDRIKTYVSNIEGCGYVVVTDDSVFNAKQKAKEIKEKIESLIEREKE